MSSKCHKETLKLISESEIPLDGKSKSCFRNQSKYMHKENIGGDNFIIGNLCLGKPKEIMA